MYYVARATKVQAVQFTYKITHPTWLIRQINAGRVYWQGGDDPHYTVETSHGPKRCSLWSWIVLDAYGDLHVYTAPQFIEAYEPDNVFLRIEPPKDTVAAEGGAATAEQQACLTT